MYSCEKKTSPRSSIDALSQLISLRRLKTKEDTCIEIEARLKCSSNVGGENPHRGDNSEKSLGLDLMEKLLSRFENAEKGTFDSETGWVESHDTFFDVPTPASCHKKKTIRSTSISDSDALEFNTANMIKARLGIVELVGSGELWRVCASKEKNVHYKTLPTTVTANYVRIKHRKSFTYSSPSCSDALRWRYDFTLSWSGNTRKVASDNQRTISPKYEFEIELLEAHPDLSDTYIAESFLAKMKDFSHPPSLPLYVKKVRIV